MTVILRSLRIALLFVGMTFVSGCYIRQMPDPNQTGRGAIPPAYVMQRNIANSYAVLDKRVQKGELPAAARDRMIAGLVKTYADLIKVNEVPKKSAWRYADVLRQAGRWNDAESLLLTAVKIAPDEDRRINDSLQLARVQAHLGKLDEAFSTVDAILDAKPEDGAPIMMSVLYELVPEAAGKGKDKQLAQLLQRSIEVHNKVVVDPDTVAGKDFLLARPMHVNRAWSKVMTLLSESGSKDDLRKAVEMQQKMSSGNASL